MKKLIMSGGIALFTIPCLCYYVAKYYIYKTLTFEQSMIIMFTIFCSLMIFGMLLGMYNAYQNIKLHNQNIRLNNKIQELENKIEQYHYDNLEYHEDNRELFLDLEKGGN